MATRLPKAVQDRMVAQPCRGCIMGSPGAAGSRLASRDVYKVIQLLGLLLTGILDFLADAVFMSAPWSRRTTRILVGILAVLLVISAGASWAVLGWLIR